jgi:hypothetical protein
MNLQARRIKKLSEKSIRKIKMVIDLEDSLNLELPLDEFIKIIGQDLTSPRYRIVAIEVVTCSEDQQPVLVSECGSCPKFVKRFSDKIFCKKEMSL